MNIADFTRHARYTVECYSNPTQFSSPDEFLEALSEALDELCKAYGAEPPKIEGIWSREPESVSSMTPGARVTGRTVSPRLRGQSTVRNRHSDMLSPATRPKETV